MTLQRLSLFYFGLSCILSSLISYGMQEQLSSIAISKCPLETQGLLLDNWLENKNNSLFEHNIINPQYEPKPLDLEFVDLLLISKKLALYSRNALQFLLYYEIDRIRKNPKNILNLCDSNQHNILLCISRIKEESEKNELYNALNSLFTIDNRINIGWYKTFEQRCIKDGKGYMPIIIDYLPNCTVTTNQNPKNSVNPNKKSENIDITFVHSSIFNYREKEPYRASGGHINKIKYGMKEYGTYDKRCDYDYYYNEQCVIAYDVASQSSTYLFPLLPYKGDNLLEQLFLDSFISLAHSECNDFNCHFTLHPIKSVQEGLIKGINSLKLSNYKKLAYESLIYTNIMNVTRAETKRKTILYNIRAGIAYLFFSRPLLITALFVCYKTPSLLIAFVHHFGLLGTIISYTISPIMFLSTALVIFFYIIPIKWESCDGPDIGCSFITIQPAKIDLIIN